MIRYFAGTALAFRTPGTQVGSTSRKQASASPYGASLSLSLPPPAHLVPASQPAQASGKTKKHIMPNKDVMYDPRRTFNCVLRNEHQLQDGIQRTELHTMQDVSVLKSALCDVQVWAQMAQQLLLLDQRHPLPPRHHLVRLWHLQVGLVLSGQAICCLPYWLHARQVQITF